MAADPNKLAIFVTSPQNMTHVAGIAEAADKNGKKPMIFFTYKSVHLTKDPRFKALAELCGEDDIAICADSYTCEGYDSAKDIPAGLSEKQMRTQAFHGALLDECGKYIVL
jgi:pterin-4a-carbinolamine dehydratase